MRQHVWTLAVLACLVAFCNVAESRSLVKREANGGHEYAHGHVRKNFLFKNNHLQQTRLSFRSLSVPETYK